MSAHNSPPGWYGKLPTLGDFASRRLAPAFIEPWDTWLAEGIAGLRTEAGEAWLDAYLASPVWRFVLMPGVIGQDTAMAGVLMPSVDRVGRYFPLTLVAPIEPMPIEPRDTEALLAWLHQLEDAAADALHEDWSVDQLEAELARLAPPPPMTTLATSPSAMGLEQVLRRQAQHAALPLAGGADLSALLSQSAATSWQSLAQGLSFWWAESQDDGPPRCLVSRGLPRDDAFAVLLGSAAA